MADNRWIGATTPGDVNVAGNWSDGMPTADDVVMVLAESDGQPGATVNPTACAAVDLNMFYFGPGYTKTWGGPGAPIQVSADIVHYQASAGKLYLLEGTAAGASNNVICDSSASDPFNHDCLQLSGSTFDRLSVLRGMCTLESGCTITDIVVGSRNGNNAESQLVINAGVNAPTSVTLHSGYGQSLINPVKLVVMGGTWVQSAGGAVITTLEVWGGTVILKFGGTYTNVRHFGGTIDCTKGGGAKTFTNYFRHPGAVLMGENNPALCVLPTAPPALTYIGN